MTEQRTGAVLTMTLLVAFLLGIGIWQFGSLGLGGGEHEDDDEHEYEEHHTQYENSTTPVIDIDGILNRIVVEENARIIEVEREVERGRDLYEIKLVGSDGRVRELKVDAGSGNVVDRE